MIPGCDKHFFYATPDLFLALIANASYVVVSSFHGTVFSINFNKDFLSITPDRFNSRVNDLLDLAGLEYRKVSTVDDVTEKLINNSIDYVLVNNRLEMKREESKSFLKHIIKEG